MPTKRLAVTKVGSQTQTAVPDYWGGSKSTAIFYLLEVHDSRSLQTEKIVVESVDSQGLGVGDDVDVIDMASMQTYFAKVLGVRRPLIGITVGEMGLMEARCFKAAPTNG